MILHMTGADTNLPLTRGRENGGMVLGPAGSEDARKRAGGLLASLARVVEDRTSRALPPLIRSDLLQTLSGPITTIVTVLLTAVVLLWSELARHGSRIAVMATGAAIGLLALRSLLILRDRRDADPAADPSPRIMLFGLAAIASSACWGLICLCVLALEHDPVLYALSLVATCGIAGAVAARNLAFPRIALLQMLASLLPAFAGCLLADDAGYRALMLIIPLLFVGLSVVVVERHRQLVGLMLAQNELKRLAQTDSLTGLANRRRLDEAQSEEWRRAARTGTPLSLLLIDADRFKSYNDLYGHRRGDQVLIAIASVLRAGVQRAGDLPARQGGEEFAVLLPGVAQMAAIAVAERLRVAVQALAIVHAGSEAGVVTVSIGVACGRPASGQPVIDLFETADRALYRAKDAGRNRVEG